MSTNEIVLNISSYVNTYNVPYAKFNHKMSSEHRTLQQTFTKLCLSWIEHVASDEYQSDPRNEQSKEICIELMNLFKDKMISSGFSGLTLSNLSKPSQYINI